MVTFRLATPRDTTAVLMLLAEIMRLHGVDPPEEERLAPLVRSLLRGADGASEPASPRCTSPGSASGPSSAPAPHHSFAPVPDHSILVAEEAGKIVGMCAVVFSLSTWSASPVCEVQDLVVTSEHRRSRIGRGLLETAADLARERGCSRLFLLAESWNLDAHAFYRRLGLKEKTCLYFERTLLSSDLPRPPRSVE